MSETASTLIQHAMRAIGAIGSGETPTTQEYSDALKTLQMMLRHWSANDLRLYYMTFDSLTISSGTGVYSIGVGGDVDNGINPPSSIRNAYYSTGGIDYSLKIVGEREYLEKSMKTTGGIPEILWYNPGYPLSYIWVYPRASGTIMLWSLVPLTEPSTVDASCAFPAEYDEAIIYGLAVRLAVEYGRDPSPLVLALAKSSMEALELKNFANSISPVRSEVIKIASRYNIDADLY